MEYAKFRHAVVAFGCVPIDGSGPFIVWPNQFYSAPEMSGGYRWINVETLRAPTLDEVLGSPLVDRGQAA